MFFNSSNFWEQFGIDVIFSIKLYLIALRREAPSFFQYFPAFADNRASNRSSSGTSSAHVVKI